MKLGIDFAAGPGNQRGGALPAPDSFLALCFFFEQVNSGSQDIYLVLDSEPPLEAFDPALVLFLNHQQFAHINLKVYRRIYHKEGNLQTAIQT